jgi:hypothetical protein
VHCMDACTDTRAHQPGPLRMDPRPPARTHAQAHARTRAPSGVQSRLAWRSMRPRREACARAPHACAGSRVRAYEHKHASQVSMRASSFAGAKARRRRQSSCTARSRPTHLPMRERARAGGCAHADWAELAFSFKITPAGLSPSAAFCAHLQVDRITAPPRALAVASSPGRPPAHTMHPLPRERARRSAAGVRRRIALARANTLTHAHAHTRTHAHGHTTKCTHAHTNARARMCKIAHKPTHT